MVIRNHSRFSFRKSYAYLFFVLVVLLMSWEGHRIDAAVIEGGIPQESIRLRILANSDSPQDQAVKRHVRDAIVAELAAWVDGPQTIEEARANMQARLPELEALVAKELQDRGFQYTSKVELGVVDFPTKMYGSRVYPAGDYEALRVSLGNAEGQNWWCVLFPPLCFVDAMSGEATAAPQADSEAVVAVSADAAADAGTEDAQAPQMKFFLWELLESFIDFVRNLFS
ncbi:stage II sporulation protein R [Paenibacillaceae bacterium]|nr:stage II sporulation protein R [Paenibacillaceae bacterium]